MNVETRPIKPLGIKAYGSIPHLLGSRMGPGDHHVHPGMARIATEKVRDKYDRVIVQEKLDGSCTAVAKVDGQIVALGRSGYPAITSPYRQHHLFHDWVEAREEDFDAMLQEGERAVGEWLAQAHGTRYDLTDRQPWVMFDIIRGSHDDKGYVARFTVDTVVELAEVGGFVTPAIVCEGPTTSEDAIAALWTYGRYGAIDPVEGAIWRIERSEPNRLPRVDLVKFVRPDKVDGAYLPETDAGKAAGVTEAVWNWLPA